MGKPVVLIAELIGDWGLIKLSSIIRIKKCWRIIQKKSDRSYNKDKGNTNGMVKENGREEGTVGPVGEDGVITKITFAMLS